MKTPFFAFRRRMTPNEQAPDTPATPIDGQDTANTSAAGNANGNAAAPQTPEPQVAASAESRLAELEARHAEMADAYLRAKADTENTRRRAEEEVSKARKFAIDGFAESLLPVKDSLEAALAIPDASREQMLEGVHATLRQLSSALERNRVVEVNPPAGTRFDPHQHQAISVVPAEQDANTVVAVLQKGYLIADRVLRPALVTVAAPK
jgi:molecular chaperone GrpE